MNGMSEAKDLFERTTKPKLHGTVWVLSLLAQPSGGGPDAWVEDQAVRREDGGGREQDRNDSVSPAQVRRSRDAPRRMFALR